jgi:hypothetical protein
MVRDLLGVTAGAYWRSLAGQRRRPPTSRASASSGGEQPAAIEVEGEGRRRGAARGGRGEGLQEASEQGPTPLSRSGTQVFFFFWWRPPERGATGRRIGRPILAAFGTLKEAWRGDVPAVDRATEWERTGEQRLEGVGVLSGGGACSWVFLGMYLFASL